MATASQLAVYQKLVADLSIYERIESQYNDLATAMSKKLSEQESMQEKWYSASDTAEDICTDPTKSLVLKGDTYLISLAGGDFSARRGTNHRVERAKLCEDYANAKVPKFDQDKLDEYTDLDIEYSTMVSMYDTLIEELKSQKDGLKDNLSTEAQDNHMLS